MGKIKTKLIKRTAEVLIEKDLNLDETFETNKKVLGKEMPSKKVRNQIAGYMARLVRMKNKKQAEIDKEIQATKK